MNGKKILSIILVFTLLFSVYGISINASDNQDEISFVIEASSKDMINRSYFSKPVDAELKLASPTATNYKFYNYISDEAKAFYNAFLEEDAGLTSAPQGTISVSLSAYGRNYSQADLQTAVCYACAAITDDYPEYQWLLSAPFEINYKKSTNTVTLKTVMSQIPYKNWREVENEHNNLLAAVEGFKVSGSNRYEQVKDIYTKLGRLASYSENLSNNTDATNSKIFYPSSALLYPYQTVCDGYSKAFKMICDANDIPCLVVCGYGYSPSFFNFLLIGGGHAWNYVQMEDGKWYALDLTWDDAGSSVNYDYFLVGSTTMDKNGNLFGTTHKATGDRFIGTSLTYPALNAKGYVYKAPQPDDNDILLGDVTNDGNITIIDAKWILQAVAGVRELSSQQKFAADINCDGNVSIIDAKWVLQCVAGIR